MATVESGSSRSIGWARRRATLRTNWRTFMKNRQGRAGLIILTVFIIIAIVGPFVIGPNAIEPSAATGPILAPPSWAYPLGTDNFGRSVLSLMIVGTRISLMVGFLAAFGAIAIGAVVGITAGYFGGTKVDTVLNAFTNWFLVLPWIALAIAIASIVGPTLINVIIVIAITSWASTARIVRAQSLSVRERPFVERSRALGAGNWHMITRHILPNVFPILFANAILMVALAILSETTLSILGLGSATAMSWGRIIEESFNNGAMSAGAWWWLVPPGIAISVVTLSFTMVGYALDEVLSPRLRGR
jgi:peptide/nickel transport system permease protein